MTPPKWKQRQLRAKSDLEKAETAERHRRFWEAVTPRYFEDQPDTFVERKPYDELEHFGPIG